MGFNSGFKGLNSTCCKPWRVFCAKR